METPHEQPPHPMTPEAVKQAEFSAVVRSFFFRLRQEAPSISTFTFGKQFPIINVAGGVKAIGQKYSSIAFDVYKGVVSH